MLLFATKKQNYKGNNTLSMFLFYYTEGIKGSKKPKACAICVTATSHILMHIYIYFPYTREIKSYMKWRPILWLCMLYAYSMHILCLLIPSWCTQFIVHGKYNNLIRQKPVIYRISFSLSNTRPHLFIV